MYLCEAMTFRNTTAKIISTGFGFGYWPWGPGTAGAFVATLIWTGLGYILSPQLLMRVTALLIILFTLIGTWATKILMPCWGNDPSRVVVDEMVGVWIPLSVVAGCCRFYSIPSLRYFKTVGHQKSRPSRRCLLGNGR